MNLGEFWASISRAIRRPNEVANIPDWTAEAANLIETTMTASWMKKFGQITVDHTAIESNQIAFPNSRVKRFEWIKLYRMDANGVAMFTHDLRGVDPSQVISIDQALPTGYWLDGLSYIYTDGKPQEDIQLWLRWAEFTDWPTDSNASPALLQRGLSLLKAETLLVAARDLRDVRLGEIYQGYRERALQALVGSEAELEFTHQSDMQLYYAPQG